MNNIEAMARAIFRSRNGSAVTEDSPIFYGPAPILDHRYSFVPSGLFDQAWTAYWSEAIAAADAAGITVESMPTYPDKWVLIRKSEYDRLTSSTTEDKHP